METREGFLEGRYEGFPEESQVGDMAVAVGGQQEEGKLKPSQEEAA